MLLRKQRISVRRHHLLALAIVTSGVLLILGQQLPHQVPHLPQQSLQRRNVALDASSKPVELEVPPGLRSQEEELIIKIKKIASESLKSERMLGKLTVEKQPPAKAREKPLPRVEVEKKVKQTEKGLKLSDAVKPPAHQNGSLPVKTNDDKAKLPVNEPEVVKKIITVNLVPTSKPLRDNSTLQPHRHPDRFKFIFKNERVSLQGPKVNSIPEQITWRHELDHVTVCNSTDPFILAIVVSAVPKRDLRDYIRRTWANPRLYPYTKIRSIFIVGATQDKLLQDAVDKEYAQYSDIIQYNFIDSYGNLTYKSLAWLNWVGKNCPQAQFIAKIDDDVMVNPFHLREFFERQLKVPPEPKLSLWSQVVKFLQGVFWKGKVNKTLSLLENPATAYIYGRYDSVPYPLRYTKWAVSMEEYPEGKYPPFVHGPAYVVGRAAAKIMLEYAPYVPFLKLEDVYTTGLLAHAAQVKHVQINGVINTFKASSKLYNGTQALMEETSPKSRKEAWEGIALYAPVDIQALGTPWT